MVNFVECFAEVKEYGVCLSFVIERAGKVFGCCDELSFAVAAFPKSMLEWGDEVVAVQVLHDVAVYYVFKEFGGYASEGDGSVVFCCLLAAFFVDGDDESLLPV